MHGQVSWRYASDRGQYYAGRGRDSIDRTTWRCDERVCTDRDQLSVGEKYKIPEDFFKKHDIHIHIPEGAVPKDGPSAGITMATAMISAITNTKVRADVAMTGEITLRGRVLPIGGLKEKLLAAKSAGVKTVLVPEKNMRDVEEISSEITRGLEIIPVSYMDEVLKTALIYEENENEN